MKSGIYAIKNKVNNKIYIGQSKNLSKRKIQHFKKLIKGNHFNTHLQKSFNKYGKDNFEFIVLERVGKNKLDEKEMEYIDNYNSMNKKKGYNLRAGGHKPKLCKKSREKISETRKERISKGLIEVREGHSLSERTKNKIRKSNIKFYKKNPNKRIEVSQQKSTIELNKVKTIKKLLYLDMSIREISNKININIDKINHIKWLDTFEYVLPRLNYYISHRREINRKKLIKKALKAYREGKTQKEIGNIINKHRRTAVRIVDENKTEFDELMRSRTKRFKRNKRYRLVKLMYCNGWNTVELAEKFKMSRNTIKKILDGEYDIEVNKFPD